MAIHVLIPSRVQLHDKFTSSLKADVQMNCDGAVMWLSRQGGLMLHVPVVGKKTFD